MICRPVANYRQIGRYVRTYGGLFGGYAASKEKGIEDGILYPYVFQQGFLFKKIDSKEERERGDLNMKGCP